MSDMTSGEIEIQRIPRGIEPRTPTPRNLVMAVFSYASGLGEVFFTTEIQSHSGAYPRWLAHVDDEPMSAEFAAKIEQGSRDFDAGRTVTGDDLRREM